MTMKVKAIAPWFGGKRTLMPSIIIELGKPTQLFDPCCGGLSLPLAMEPCQKETVNDLHGDVMNLARVIADRTLGPDLYDRLVRAPFCEALLNDAKEYFSGSLEPDPDSKDVTRAYWFFLASWMGRNGTAGTQRTDYQLAVRWTKNGGSPTVRWKHAVGSMPAWHLRLLNVVMLQRDMFKIVDRFEDVAQTSIYVDPPYLPESRTGYRTGKGSENRYLHEFNHESSSLLEQPDDHERLRDILNEYKHARIVVSYYDCARARELYDGWTFVKHTRQKNLHQQSGRGARLQKAPEVLIINGPSYAPNISQR